MEEVCEEMLPNEIVSTFLRYREVRVGAGSPSTRSNDTVERSKPDDTRCRNQPIPSSPAWPPSATGSVYINTTPDTPPSVHASVHFQGGAFINARTNVDSAPTIWRRSRSLYQTLTANVKLRSLATRTRVHVYRTRYNRHRTIPHRTQLQQQPSQALPQSRSVAQSRETGGREQHFLGRLIWHCHQSRYIEARLSDGAMSTVSGEAVNGVKGGMVR